MKETIAAILHNVARVVIGKEKEASLALAAMLADGHVLLEDMPGTGKTRLARALSDSMGLSFRRIQFTPDMLPADITGLHVFDRQTNSFVLKKGPVFTHILLADEINRATPRTQAGLLECMEERQVTIDGETCPLELPYFVIATQNPVETAGTFPLPQAQLDRFLMKLSMGLPSREEEIGILQTYSQDDPLTRLQAVVQKEDILRMKREASQVFVHPAIQGYLADLAIATRNSDKVAAGISPRGTLALMRAAKAWAFLNNRAYVIPDDVKAVSGAVLGHRLILPYGQESWKDGVRLVEEILDRVPAPTEDFETEPNA